MTRLSILILAADMVENLSHTLLALSVIATLITWAVILGLCSAEGSAKEGSLADDVKNVKNGARLSIVYALMFVVGMMLPSSKALVTAIGVECVSEFSKTHVAAELSAEAADLYRDAKSLLKKYIGTDAKSGKQSVQGDD